MYTYIYVYIAFCNNTVWISIFETLRFEISPVWFNFEDIKQISCLLFIFMFFIKYEIILKPVVFLFFWLNWRLAHYKLMIQDKPHVIFLLFISCFQVLSMPSFSAHLVYFPSNVIFSLASSSSVPDNYTLLKRHKASFAPALWINTSLSELRPISR